MKTKGQIGSVIVFVLFVSALIIVTPILLKIMNITIGSFGNALTNSTIAGGQQAGQTANYIKDKTLGLWDFVVVSLFTFNVILLFISAFLVDNHPAFVILYIFAMFFLFLTVGGIINIQDIIFENGAFSTETNYIPILNFIRENFTAIILGVIFLSGVIAYGRFSRGTGGVSPY